MVLVIFGHCRSVVGSRMRHKHVCFWKLFPYYLSSLCSSKYITRWCSCSVMQTGYGIIQENVRVKTIHADYFEFIRFLFGQLLWGSLRMHLSFYIHFSDIIYCQTNIMLRILGHNPPSDKLPSQYPPRTISP